MTSIFIGTIYALGFSFFLGYARGHDSNMPTAIWAHALFLATIWPIALLWFIMRRLDGTSPRVLSLAFLFLAAPAHATFDLTVSTAGPTSGSSRVTSDPAGIDCPSTCTFAFAEGSTVTLTRVMASTVAFVGWGGAQGCRTNRATCFLTLDANASVSATFAPTLDISISGNGIGVISSSGTAITCSSTGTCASGASLRMVLQTGTTFVLQATAGSSTTFTGWTDSAAGCSTASTCTVVMDGYRTAVATFTAAGTVGVSSYTIRVVVPNGGGIVRSTPSGILCGTSTTTACTADFVSGGTITFSTEAIAGYRFAGWANGGCHGNNTCVIQSTSPLQSLGGKYSPSAFFYRVRP